MLDTLLDRVANWLVGAAITLDIKFRQPGLFRWLIDWTDDDPYGVEEPE